MSAAQDDAATDGDRAVGLLPGVQPAVELRDQVGQRVGDADSDGVGLDALLAQRGDLRPALLHQLTEVTLVVGFGPLAVVGRGVLGRPRHSTTAFLPVLPPVNSLVKACGTASIPSERSSSLTMSPEAAQPARSAKAWGCSLA